MNAARSTIAVIDTNPARAAIIEEGLRKEGYHDVHVLTEMRGLAARIAVVGLAPGAHGANRTGRVFTGDRSGDVLTSCMYAAGLADQPTSTGPGDGLELIDARLLCAVRCAPPQNRPSADEQAACHPFLVEELSRLPLQVIVALGQLAWNAAHGASW